MKKLLKSTLVIGLLASASSSHALIDLGFASWELGPMARVGNVKALENSASLSPTWTRYYGLGISNHFHFAGLMLSADLSWNRKKLHYEQDTSSTKTTYDLTAYEVELPVMLWNVHDLEMIDLRYGAGVNLLRGHGKVKSHTSVALKGSGLTAAATADQTYSQASLKQNHYGISAGFGVDVELLLIKLATDLRYTYVPNRGTNGSKIPYHSAELMVGLLF